MACREVGNYDDPEWQEALHDNMQTPVPDQAAFRCDFPRWLRRLGSRKRRIAEKMLLGERTTAAPTQITFRSMTSIRSTRWSRSESSACNF